LVSNQRNAVKLLLVPVTVIGTVSVPTAETVGCPTITVLDGVVLDGVGLSEVAGVEAVLLVRVRVADGEVLVSATGLVVAEVESVAVAFAVAAAVVLVESDGAVVGESVEPLDAALG